MILVPATHSQSLQCKDMVMGAEVSLRKTTSINLRMSPQMKELLRLAAEREHRTLSNMLETLILGYCQIHNIEALPEPPARQGGLKKTKADIE
jgi:hypothetical protein